MRLSGPLSLLFLVGLAAGSWWLAQRGRETRPQGAAPVAAQPGYYLTDALLEQTDETGRTTLRAHAARAAQAVD
ncbi:MAG: hypothetical protein JSR54_19405, partial [Proteobacteria bacterium]|nr:hypothetical protein [Pseudomonadota bacterium]